MLAAPLITVLVRSFGIRPVMLLGAAIIGGGFVSASFASRIWHLYLTQGVMVGLGVGFLYVPGINILSQWFSSKRTLVNGISAAGSGIGAVAFSFAADAIIRHLSVGWSLRITGIVVFLFNFMAAVFVRDRNAQVQPKQRPFDLDLLQRKEVLLLLSWAFLSMLGYITLLYSLSDFALAIGLSREEATQVTAFLNMGTALIRPFIGVASDRLGRFNVATGLTLLCGIMCLAVWIPATSFGVTIFFAIVNGGILGVFWMV
jgi:nitrate/nitrite transporter NarK